MDCLMKIILDLGIENNNCGVGGGAGSFCLFVKFKDWSKSINRGLL